MTVTRELLERGKSDRGGWSRAQLALLDVPWPPPRGWGQEVLGREIDAETAARFVALRNDFGGASPCR